MHGDRMIQTRVKITGFTLVEILIVMVILVILGSLLGATLLGNGSKNDRKATTPIAKAHQTVCMTNLHSVRDAIAIAKTGETEDTNPASLDELHLPAEVTHCDIGHEAYLYDPNTGRVMCPHPGHENF